MKEFRFKEENAGEVYQVHFTFGVKDQKGRAVGATAWISKVIVKEIHPPNDGKAYSFMSGGGVDSNGEYYRIRISAKRDGEPFGATQNAHYFKKESDMGRHLEEKIDAMKIRYEKKFKEVQNG